MQVELDRWFMATTGSKLSMLREVLSSLVRLEKRGSSRQVPSRLSGQLPCKQVKSSVQATTVVIRTTHFIDPTFSPFCRAKIEGIAVTPNLCVSSG